MVEIKPETKLGLLRLKFIKWLICFLPINEKTDEKVKLINYQIAFTKAWNKRA